MTEETGPQQDGRQSPEPSKPSWYKRRSTWIVAAVVVVLAIIGTAIGGEESDDDSGSTDQASSSSTDTGEKSPDSGNDDSSSSGNRPAGATIADDVTDKLDAISPGCTWEETGKSVFIKSCMVDGKDGDYMVVANDSSRAVKSWLSGVADRTTDAFYDPWVLMNIKQTYAVITPQQGKVNIAWDMLGADGTRKHLSDYK